ncbi:hypothetical protein FNH05_10905 [Amycolatopsis rhizosphaerae]|uniref:Uncharacterized protein n=1 Tax=Amycolatopsis rhizosphaerae TaxID=2053003 RepID=A0A558CZB3_9PSEU|nr:hypothetical protein [Amycolatopsis rhizosphaerae]TVT54097.1 hypothetical protein FNH05_10905 [Amycolatopsis rhizosphaerae]
MGAGPGDGILDQGWFGFYDDTVEVDPSSEADRVLLAGLRARAASRAWPCDPSDTWAYHALEDGRHLLRVGVRLDTWLSYGVEFDGTRIVGDECHHEIPFDLTGPMEMSVEYPGPVEYAGPVEFLVERAAAWLEPLVSRPIELRMWCEDGEVRHQEWVLAGLERKLKGRPGRRPDRPPDQVTVLRVPEPGRAHGYRRRWWDFGRRRGRQGE